MFCAIVNPILANEPATCPIAYANESKKLFAALVTSGSVKISFKDFHMESRSFFIPSKKAKGEKLDKWEKKFYQENKNIIDIKTRLSDEEQAYKDALNEMLNLK